MRTQRLTSIGFAFLVCLVCLNVARAQANVGKNVGYTSLVPEMINRELTTVDGSHLKLSDYENRVIVLNLFAPWCAPCRQNIWDLNRLRKQYKTRIQVIGLVAQFNDPQKSITSFADQLKINFPVIWDDIDFSESLHKLIDGLDVLPQTFVIDNQYRIRKHFMGFNSKSTPQVLRKTLDAIGRERRSKKRTGSS